MPGLYFFYNGEVRKRRTNLLRLVTAPSVFRSALWSTDSHTEYIEIVYTRTIQIEKGGS